MLNIYEAAESSLQTALTVGTPDAFYYDATTELHINTPWSGVGCGMESSKNPNRNFPTSSRRFCGCRHCHA